MLTQAELMRRGWTARLIAELLPPPERAENRYQPTTPLKLWDEAVVREAEQAEAFRTVAERREQIRARRETRRMMANGDGTARRRELLDERERLIKRIAEIECELEELNAF